MSKKRILVTNDDGIDAAGIKLLEETLEGLGELFVIAPAEEQSGASHSLTIGKPVRISERDPHHIAIAGTPTDCVLLAHHSLMDKNIDLVVSGINMGYNLADDVLYSGTVAAAMEGRLLRYPSVAISADRDLATVARASLRFVREFTKMILDSGQPSFASINLPKGEPKGVRATRLGKRVYKDVVNRARDENGEVHLILSGELSSVAVEGSDTEAVDSGYISVTPLHLDLTDYGQIDELREDLQGLTTFRKLNS
jgi:5'-nucleotidase